jgi:hypothetical protein
MTMPARVIRKENIIMIPGSSSDKNALRNGNRITRRATITASIFFVSGFIVYILFWNLRSKVDAGSSLRADDHHS